MDDSTKFADMATELLEHGHSVKFRAPGRSMHPTIKEGETITVEPIAPTAVKRGHIILYRSESGVIAHRVARIEQMASSSEATPKAARPLLKSRQGRHGPQGPKGLSSSAQSSSLSPQHFFLLRGDASFNCDYPVKPEQILGKVVSVERGGRRIDLYTLSAKAQHMAHVSILKLKRLLKESF